MKKIKSQLASLVGLSLLAGSLSSCGSVPGTSVVTVEPGFSGLKIQLYGGEKGIDNAQLVSGRVWYNGYTENVVVFPTYINTYPFTKSTTEGSPTDESVVFSVSGSPVSADVGVSFGFTTEKVTNKDGTKLHHFYKQYRTLDSSYNGRNTRNGLSRKTPDAFRANELRNGLRNCFSTVAENQKLTPSMLPYNQQKLVAGVTECTQQRFPTIAIQDVSLLSPLRLPKDIQRSIDEQFAAQQAAQTAEANRRKVEAEAAANIARAKGEAQVSIERARAESEANRLRAISITPELLELEQLQIERERINKWNGHEPSTIIQSPNVQLGSRK